MHLLGYATLISGLVYGIGFLARYLAKRKKKEPFFPQGWWKDELWDGGLNFLFTFSAALVLALAFGGFSFWNALLFLLCSSAVVLLIRPSHWIKKIQERGVVSPKEKRQFIFSFSILTFLLLELFAFNANAYKDHLSQTLVSIADSSISLSSDTTPVEEGARFQSSSYFVWTKGKETPSRIRLAFSTDESLELTVSCASSSNGTSYVVFSKFTCNPVQEGSCVVALPSSDSYTSLKFTLSFAWDRLPYGDHAGESQSVVLQGVELDAPILFDFSFLRFGLVSLLTLCLSFFKPFVEHYEDKKVEIHRKWELGILLGGLSVLLIFVIYAFINQSTYFSLYPLSKNVQDYDIYTQMFDAFKKGQLNIDVPSSTSGSSLLWDHAYYDGKCYSYYGIIPVLLVSFPCYFLSHLVPKVLFLEVFGAILEVTGLLLLIVEICRVFFKKMPLSALIFTLVISLFLTLTFGLVTAKSYYIGGNPDNPCVEGIYHIPTIYGMLNLDVFFLFCLYAYPGAKKRMLYLAFAGLFFVFIMASRPNLFLSLIFVAPLLLKILFEKDVTWKKKILTFLPMVGILLVGGFFIAKYNYDRFGSILEYGQRYQNTISNQTDLRVKSEQILPALMHFFLNPWSYNSSTTFPFIGTTNPHFTASSSDYSFYLNWYSGVFSIPFFLTILTLPFTNQKGSDKWLNAVALLLPVTMAVLAVVTYSFAGLCPRYMLETYHLATLASCIACFRLFEKRKEARTGLLPMVFALALVSAFICWNLANDPFFGADIGDFGGLLLRVRGVFSIPGFSLPLFLVVLVAMVQFEFVALQIFFPHRLKNQTRKKG